MSREDEQVGLSRAMQEEELARAEYVKKHRHACVPWRGCGGEIGSCIYCGKQLDALSLHLADRAASGQSPLTAHR